MRFQRSKVSTYTRVSSLCKSAVPAKFSRHQSVSTGNSDPNSRHIWRNDDWITSAKWKCQSNLLTIRDLTNRAFLVPDVIRWSRGPKGGNNSRGYLKLTAKRTEYSTITARKPPPPAVPLQGSSYLALSNQKLYKLALNRISLKNWFKRRKNTLYSAFL